MVIFLIMFFLVCLNYEEARKRKDSDNDSCWHCNNPPESHDKPCIWFDHIFESRDICRSCTKAQREHRICDKFKGPYDQACMYCGQPSTLHKLCKKFTATMSNWCKTCGRRKLDHASYYVLVENQRVITEHDFEINRREILTSRMEAQWIPAPSHFQVSNIICVNFN